jgi:dimethylhistidine N-methyltransferase
MIERPPEAQPGSRMPSHRSAAVVPLVDLRPEAGSFREDVIAGLSRAVKSLPPKYFYDARGSELFEAICELPEYYPTRTEIALMLEHGPAMARLPGPGCAVIEYGSGSGRKTRILLEAVAPVAYVAIDIAREQLANTAAQIAREFPGVAVTAVCADYSRPLELPEGTVPGSARRVIYFPGSTIGNLSPHEAAEFLVVARRLAGAGGGMLVGVDLKKDSARLNAAYNDESGVTARFNLNLLARINRELGGDFDLSAFRHHAFYNERLGRIEMHLVSLKEQRVRVDSASFSFRGGETIHTENSYKYTVAEFQALARGAGFEPAACWTDADELFAVHYLAAPSRAPAR